jgi:uncharacterized protein
MMDAVMFSLTDKILFGFNQIFFVGKFYLIFSLLFGVSFYIQTAKPQANGQAWRLRFAWRLLLLLGFGYIHHFFYRGDILMLYALIGFLLLPLNHLSSKTLLILAVFFFLGGGRFLGFILLSDSAVYGMPGYPDGSEALTHYFQTLKSGSLAEVFTINAWDGIKNVMIFQFGMGGRGYLTLALFLLGIVLGRTQFFQNLDSNIPQLKRLMLWSLPVIVLSIAATVFLFMQVEQPMSFRSWPEVFAFTAYDLANLSISLLITAGFLKILLTNRGKKVLSIFAPYGRMALSNYLLQALIGTSIFYGYGLGLIAELGATQIFAIALLIFSFQLVLSHLWMTVFLFGPLEWLWRSATKLELVKLKR